MSGMPKRPAHNALLWCRATKFAVITIHVVVDAAGAAYEVAVSSWGGLVRAAIRVRSQALAFRLVRDAAHSKRFADAAALLALSPSAL